MCAQRWILFRNHYRGYWETEDEEEVIIQPERYVEKYFDQITRVIRDNGITDLDAFDVLCCLCLTYSCNFNVNYSLVDVNDQRMLEFVERAQCHYNAYGKDNLLSY